MYAHGNGMVKPACCIGLRESDVFSIVHVAMLCLNCINNVCMLLCNHSQGGPCNAGLYHIVPSMSQQALDWNKGVHAGFCLSDPYFVTYS